MIVLDIDHFKLFNDSQGLLRGDAILKDIGAALKDSVRIVESTDRYGGEEFLAALPETSGEGAMLIADPIRNKMAALKIPHPQSPTNDFVTMPIGHTHACSRQTAFLGTWHDVVERTDRTLYSAKQDDRDRIEECTETD